MNVVKATARYERWLAARTPLIKADLLLKHQQMTAAVFPFLRATFYRWIQVWPDVCPSLAKAPKVLAVGDLHVENFGTWRDTEGRLIWGVNDFDEACSLAYTNDLVRLAASALLAISAGHLAAKPKDACSEILNGYTMSVAKHGGPFVLEEGNSWLRSIALAELRDPAHFWKKMDALVPARGDVSPGVIAALEHYLPHPGLTYRLVRRVAGLGSLGHLRFVAIADYCGGKIAREAKLLAPSAIHWAYPTAGPEEILYQVIIDRAVRCFDPFVHLHGHWILRRLSPHCSRIELAHLPKNRDECRLLFSMGWETANVHLGSATSVSGIRKHLAQQKSSWLYAAATKMATAVRRDWQVWRDAVSS